MDDERESGDGQEEQESEGGTKKKVDHDQDRSNPQYIPKKGTFYEHDDRTMEDLDEIEQQENSENPANSNEALSNSSKVLSTLNQKVTPKAKKDTDRWTHDRFNENEQAPKSRNELVSAYGYDIRNEDCAPRPRRQRRYGRNQIKYARNWEDEEAYKKTQAMKSQPRRPLRPEDFPALGSNKVASSKPQRRSSRQQDENDPQSSSNYRSPVRSREHRPRDEHDRRDSREPRSQRYNNDTSTNNNARNNVKGKKNINFNHNIEFKNQNRKNINYESTQPKNNNVLNQQMQSSSSSQQPQSSQSSSSQHHSGPRYNNEAPVSSMSFTNSKMNNANNNSNSAGGSSRTILNFDNSSGNYGRGSREKEVNSQPQMHQQQQQMTQMPSNQGPAMSPNKNLQYTDHQLEQMKLMEKSYQQGKATNLNLNQVAQHQPMNNVQEVQMMNNSDVTRSKRYSSLRQRSNVNETQPQSAPYHQQYHQQEIEQSMQMPAQQTPPAYIPQQTQQPTTMMPPQAVQPVSTQAAPVQQQQPPAQKYPQAAYYAANPASEYAAQQAALMNAMVEKYQYQQAPAQPQYLPQQQPQPIYMPTQSQPAPPQQILNYTIQSQAPAAAPAYPQYTNYQNYSIQPPSAASVPPQVASQAPPQTQATPQPIYQTQSGLTYYPNAQLAPAHPQRTIQPQR